MTHIRGARGAVFGSRPAPDDLVHFGLVQFLAGLDRTNYLLGLWRLKYLAALYRRNPDQPMALP